MDKQQGYYSFIASFGLMAYEEHSVPDDAELPYMTYEKVSSAFGEPVNPTASIWTRSNSWAEADGILSSIEQRLGNGGVIIPVDEGKIFITKGVPFAQAMDDETDKLIKRYYLNFNVEFFTFY